MNANEMKSEVGKFNDEDIVELLNAVNSEMTKRGRNTLKTLLKIIIEKGKEMKAAA